MWKSVRSIYNNHIIIYPDTYVSTDDIIMINNVIYEITGITDDSEIYVQDQNKKRYIYEPPAFLEMLNNSDFKYIKNIHQEWIEKNRLTS